MVEEWTLNNGIKLPCIGLGTYSMNNQDIVTSIDSAVKCGYRAFDTASAYKNAEGLGMAMKRNFAKREDFFISTKLSNKHQRKGNVREALKTSLSFLQLEYVDLYLMHWPNPDTYVDCYQQMEELYKEGLVRAIGVCNFHQHHLENLLKYTTVIPVINQIELHPLLTQEQLVRYCKKNRIDIMSYSPFARMNEKLIQNTIINKIAQKYNKEVTQIIIRWNYQKKYFTIPKSENAMRQKKNIDIFNFTLDNEDIDLIDSINENFRVRHNPDCCDFNHL